MGTFCITQREGVDFVETLFSHWQNLLILFLSTAYYQFILQQMEAWMFFLWKFGGGNIYAIAGKLWRKGNTSLQTDIVLNKLYVNG